MESSNVCIICGIALPEQGPSICEHDAEMLSLQIEEIKRLVSSTEEKINSLKVRDLILFAKVDPTLQ